MAEHEGESLIDKIKGAFGMGAGHQEHGAGMHEHTDGADMAGNEAIHGHPADAPNRPVGPDDGADDSSEFEAGLDRESMAGTGSSNTGTGLGYDFERREVSEPVTTERRTGVEDTGPSRDAAASGESPLDTDVDDRQERGL